MKLLTSITLLITLLWGSSSQSFAAQAEDSPPLIGSKLELQGDLEGLAKQWWSAMLAEPNSAESQFRALFWAHRFANSPALPRSSEQWQQLYDRTSNGWTRRNLGFHLQATLRQEDKLAAADRLQLAAGSPRRWIGIGPFGLQRVPALTRPYGPEFHFDRDAEYEGSDRLPVHWRKVFVAAQESRIFTADEFSRSGASYYLRSRFRSSTTTLAFLQIASSGSFKIWLDGREIITVNRPGFPSSLLRRIPLLLQAGEHTLLIKTMSAEIAVLWRDAHGHTLAIEDLDPWQSGEDAGSEDSALSPVGLASADWSRLDDSGKLPRNRWLPLALLLSLERDTRPAFEILLRAQAVNLSPPSLALVATRLAPIFGGLPAEWKKNWLTKLWQDALKIQPLAAPIQLAVAFDQFRDGRADEAMASARAVIKIHPRNLEAQLLSESIATQHQWPFERKQALDKMQDLAPHHPTVLRRWSRYLNEQLRSDLQQPLLQQLYQANSSLENASYYLRSLARSGHRTQALAILEDMLRKHEQSTAALTVAYEEAISLAAYAQAQNYLTVLFDRRPHSGSLHHHAAELALRREDFIAAERSLKKALQLRPGHMPWIRQLQHLQDEDPYAWLTPYTRDGEAAIQSAPPRDHYPRASSVYLIDQMVTRVRPAGGMEEYTHQLLRLDSAEAVEEFSTLNIPGEVLLLRVIDPSGRTLHPTADGEDGLFTLPGLEEGSFVEYKSIRSLPLRDERDLAIGPFYFRDPNFKTAFHLTEWIVTLPANWSVEVDSRQMVRSASSTQSDRILKNGLRELRWTSHRMDVLQAEFRMPPADRVVPNVRVYSPRPWQLLIDQLVANARRQDAPSAILERVVAPVLEALSTREAQVHRLYEIVCERVKSDGGANSATEIWLSQSGDRTLLLAGLLRTAKIPFQTVFAADNDAWQPYRNWAQPHVDYFRQIFLRVELEEGQSIYLNAQQRMIKAGRIPPELQGGRALLIGKQRTSWIQLPTAPMEAEARTFHTQIKLSSADQSATIKGQVEFRVFAAASLKDRFSTLNDFQQKAALENFVRGSFPAAEVGAGEFPKLKDRTAPFAIQFHCRATNLLRKTGKTWALKSIFMPSQLREGFIRKGQRHYEYQSQSLNNSIEENNFELGTDFEVVKLPEDFQRVGPWGSVTITYRQQGTQLKLMRRLQLQPFVIPAHQVQQFYDFCIAVDRKEQERITLRRRSAHSVR